MGGALCVIALGSLVALAVGPSAGAATPQTVEEIAQSLACIPPGTIGCTDQFSRIRVIESLRSAGILNSDVGAIELAYCAQSMEIYEKNLARYNSCPADQKVSAEQENGARNYLLPLLCGPVLGGHGEYDKDLETCVCSPGYFIYDNACLSPTEICHQKYASDTRSVNGNCVRPIAETPRVIATPKATPRSTSSNTPTLSATPPVSPTREPAGSLAFVRTSPSPVPTAATDPKPRNVILQFIIDLFQKIF